LPFGDQSQARTLFLGIAFMRKSRWIEAIEWCVLALVVLFTAGIIVMRGEITSSADSTSTAPVESFEE
jgi:hypothetical protein